MNYPNGGASEIWRDDNGHNPVKAEIRAWGAVVESRSSQTISVKEFGAVGDGVADDTAAIEAAVAAAISSGACLVFASGAYRTTATITFAADDLQVEFFGSARIIPVDSVLVGLVIGATNSPSRMRVVRPAVERSAYSDATENVGIQLREMNQGQVIDPESRFSKYNIDFYATNGGCGYNTIINPQGIGGYNNFRARASGTGWVNENLILGGRGFCTANTHTNFNMANGDDVAVTGVTQANPAVITAPAHGFATGDTVTLHGVLGMTKINEKPRTITVIDANSFSMAEDASGYAAYSSGGFAVSGKGTGHNRMIGMSLEGQGVQGVYDNGSSNKWDQCRSEGSWSGGSFHVYGPTCRYPVVEGSRLDYTIDKAAAVDPRDTVMCYREGSKLSTAVNGLTTLELENQSQSGGSGLDIRSHLDSATAFAIRVIRRGDGLVRASLTANGKLFLALSAYIEQHGWNFIPFRMGVLRKWVSGNGTDGYLTRHKYGSDPTSESDGAVVMESQESVDIGFNNIANVVNTKGKYRGKMVWDQTTDRPVWAYGSAAGDAWRYADGTVAYTPS